MEFGIGPGLAGATVGAGWKYSGAAVALGGAFSHRRA